MKFALSTLVSFSGAIAAQAEDLVYLPMTEFTQTCPSVGGVVEDTKTRFIDLEWTETENKDIRDVATPDDIFKNSKIDTAYEVELTTGGYWFGGVGTAKIKRQKTVFCMVTFYGQDSDRLPIEADFMAIYTDTPDILEGNGEKRLVVEIADGKGAAVHQQVTVPGEDSLVMFRTFNVMPGVKK